MTLPFTRVFTAFLRQDRAFPCGAAARGDSHTNKDDGVVVPHDCKFFVGLSKDESCIVAINALIAEASANSPSKLPAPRTFAGGGLPADDGHWVSTPHDNDDDTSDED